MKLSHRFAAAFLAATALAAPALSTWSIVVVDTRTREVCIASATCLENFNLKKFLPVLRPGLGGACSQASVDSSGTNRLIMFSGLGSGQAPSAILTQLLALSGAQSRQFGIVDFDHAPVTFSGSSTFEANPGVAAEVGEFKYAIQGNILTDDVVVLAAEQAFLAAPGDLGQKVMAAMEAARFWGGDGRCSCSPAAPTSCALPPAMPFKSAHVGFFLIARVGDTGGQSCNSAAGCATGQFYASMNVVAVAADPDPVPVLQQMYDQWRLSLAGRPDHILTEVHSSAQALVADRRSEAHVVVVARDVDGARVTHGGATLTLANLSGVPAVSVPSAVTDHGDGTYSFQLKAGAAVGEDRWRIVLDDGLVPVTLYPELALRVDPLAPLHVGFDSISAAGNPSVPLTVNAGAGARKRLYLLLASNAGTVPGLPFAGTTLPLNASNLLTFTYTNANTASLPNTFGRLDRLGRAEALFTPDPALLVQLAGTHVDWSGIVFDPLGSTALPPVGFDVLP